MYQSLVLHPAFSVNGNSSGLLTTCGGSQEDFSAGFAACGCKARRKKTRAAVGGAGSGT